MWLEHSGHTGPPLSGIISSSDISLLLANTMVAVVTLPIRMWGLREGGGQILSWTNLEDIDCIDFGGSPSTPHLEGGRYKGTKAFQEPGPLWLLYYQTGAGALNYFLNPTQETVDKGLLPNLTQQVVLGGHLQRLFSGQGSGLSNIPGFVLLPDGSVQSWIRLSLVVAELFTSFWLTMSWRAGPPTASPLFQQSQTTKTEVWINSKLPSWKRLT